MASWRPGRGFEGALTTVEFDANYNRPGFVKSLFQKMANPLVPWGRSDNRTGKPVADVNYTGYEPRVQYPRLAIPIWAMYELLHLNPDARTAINNLVAEVLRNKGEWHESFAVKCGVCGLRMKSFPPDGLCERRSCRNTVMQAKDVPGVFGIAPDDDELSFFNEGRGGDEPSEWGGVSRANRAEQTLWDVLYSFAWDVCAVDDAYMVCVKKYHWQMAGGKARLYAEPAEIVRGHPNVVRIVADDFGNRGGVFYQCPAHRSKIYIRPGAGMRVHGDTGSTNVNDSASYEGWQIPAEVLKDTTCPVFEAAINRTCGLPLKNVHFVATDSGGASPKQYYFADECYHRSYFSRSVLYGISPVATLYRLLRIRIKTDEYFQTYLEKRRIPRGIVAVNTPRREATVKLKQEINRMADDDQQGIPFVAIEGSNQRGWIEFIPFADKPYEMGLEELYQRCKADIYKFYGVAPDLSAQSPQGAGKSVDGKMALAVQNRAVRTFQDAVFNDSVFPWLAKQFGIKDHYFELNPSEEKDVAKEQELELLKLQVLGQQMNIAGLPFEGVDPNGDYKVGPKPDPESAAMLAFKPMPAPALTPPMRQAVTGTVQPGGQQPSAVPGGKRSSLAADTADEASGTPLGPDEGLLR